MEFRQLRYFVAVAEEGNIGKAARRLHVSQPPISRQIQYLEQELKAQLLVRTTKGVSLTEAGKTFLEDARKILAQMDRAKERSQAADRGEIGQLEVGFFGSVIYNTVPAALRAFQNSLPEAKVAIKRLGKDAQINALQEGSIHVGFGRYYSDTPGIKIENLGEEDVYVAVSRETDLANEVSVGFSDLSNLPLVLFPQGGRPSFADLVVGAYRNAGFEPKISTITEDVTSALAITALGGTCCLVPASVASLRFPSLRFVQLDEASVRLPLNIIYREHRQAPVLRAFLDTMRQTRGQ